MKLSPEAAEARRQYMKKYREAHKQEILAKQREYYRQDPERYKAYQQKFWERKAAEN